MKVQVIRSNRKTIGLEVRADESVILRAPAVDEISDVEWYLGRIYREGKPFL